MTSQIDNQRIAKNTFLLYARTLVVMGIMLYTSRVVLIKLGVEDYGIFQLVGGFVALFYIISSSLTTAISRFITYEIGRGDINRLRDIFSASINIQAGISLIVIMICETLGVWFLNNQMSIPPDRLYAANWVLQCSLLTFCINLMSVPYYACIVAHEKMTVFAYISVMDALLKLLICYLITLTGYDRLIAYALLMVSIAIIIRLIYGLYCSKYFPECHYKRPKDLSLLKELTGFAGWATFPEVMNIFNVYGVNLLINIYFGVVMNAARGIANQAQGAVTHFVDNFTTAINPQIIKSLAAGEKKEMFTLVCRGAKFSYFLFLLFAIPILIETEFILNFWLDTVPDKTVTFVRLALMTELITVWGNTSYTACIAKGDMKKYSIIITLTGAFFFPATWMAYKVGLPVESVYYLYMICCLALNFTRLFFMKYQMDFPVSLFLRNAIQPIVVTTLMSVLFPISILLWMNDGIWRFIVIIMISFFSVCAAIFLLGLTHHEREMIMSRIPVCFK